MPSASGPKATDRKKHNMKCKNRNCDGMEVYELDIPPIKNSGRHVYECTKCHTTWGVHTGGSVDLG